MSWIYTHRTLKCDAWFSVYAANLPHCLMYFNVLLSILCGKNLYLNFYWYELYKSEDQDCQLKKTSNIFRETRVDSISIGFPHKRPPEQIYQSCMRQLSLLIPFAWLPQGKYNNKSWEITVTVDVDTADVAFYHSSHRSLRWIKYFSKQWHYESEQQMTKKLWLVFLIRKH